MKSPTNDWPDTNIANGVLFFAQAVQQLVSTSSFESHRMMTLDTIARLEEAGSLLEDIRTGLPKVTILPVKDELKWSIEHDPAMRHQSFDELSSLNAHLASFQSADRIDVSRLISKIRVVKERETTNYRTHLEQYVLSTFSDIEKRSQLLSVISFYVSNLVNSGYSRAYISELIDEVFFLEDIVRASSAKISSFFRKFDNQSHKYSVFFEVTQHMYDYASDIMGFKKWERSSLPQAVSAAYVLSSTEHTDGMIFVSVERQSFDMYSACKSVSDELYNISAASILSNWSFESSWASCFCAAGRGHATARCYEVSDLNLRESTDIGPLPSRGVREVKGRIATMNANFTANSRERLQNSIATAYGATRSANPENRLIALWSAFEVLLSPPPTGTARISHYSEVVLPCIVTSYAMRNFVTMYNYLALNHRFGIKRFVDPLVTDNTDRYHAFVSIFADDARSDTFIELVDYIDDSPLAQHRMRDLKARFGDPKSYLRSTNGHEDRVKWQLHRIYRSRNHIVHAGKVPAYLDSLTINAFEYYRNTVNTVINSSLDFDDPVEIDDMVERIGMRHQSHIERVKSFKNNPFSTRIHSKRISPP